MPTAPSSHERDRDLLPRLPLLTWKAAGAELGHLAAPDRRRLISQTNETARVFRALACGSVSLDTASMTEWAAGTEKEREMMHMILDRWRAWEPEMSLRPQPSEALRLVGASASMYDRSMKCDKAHHKPKGEVCPITVSGLSLPPAGTRPVPLTKISPTCAAFLSKFRERMLRKGEEIDWKMLERQKVYTDNVFHKKASLLELAARLYESGMLASTSDVQSTVVAFWGREGLHRCGRAPHSSSMGPTAGQLLVAGTAVHPLGITSGDVQCGSVRARGWQGDLVSSWRLAGLVLPLGGARGNVALLRPKGCLAGGASEALVRNRSDLHFEGRRPSGHQGLADGVVLGPLSRAQCAYRRLGPDPWVAGIRYATDPRKPRTTTEERDRTQRLPSHLGIIDDYGALPVPGAAELSEDARGQAEEWSKKTREGMKERGFDVHKELVAHAIPAVLGACLSGRPYVLAVPRAKVVTLISATRFLISCPFVSTKALEKVIGLWTWVLLLRRPALAILGRVYHTMRENMLKKTCRLPREVREELVALCALAPWMETDLETPWLEEVFATDASMTGYGVVQTNASPIEIRSEARFAETKGWIVCLEAEHAEAEESAWIMTEDAAEDTFERAVAARPAPVLKQRVFRVAHLFSGHRRPEDFEWHIALLASNSEFPVEVWSVDMAIDPLLDLSVESVVAALIVAFAAGFFHLALAGPPCSTWSRARFNWKHRGPRPLRTRSEPWGRTDVTLTSRERKQLELGTRLLLATLRLFLALAQAGGIYILEHPRDPMDEPFPSIWALPEVDELRLQTSGDMLQIDQCMYGQTSRKATTLMTNSKQAGALLNQRCVHTSHPEKLEGKDAEGNFRTSRAQCYPSALCQMLATVAMKELRSMHVQGEGPDPRGHLESIEGLTFPPVGLGRSSAERRYGHRVPAPPLSSTWLPVERWRLTYKGRWMEEEHITVQELRVAVGLLRHLARPRKNWRRRVLILIDSTAALGALCKGRSSSPALLRLCRQVAAYSLAFGFLVVGRYIASEVNPADGPSRDLRVGAADETRAAHADRLTKTLRDVRPTLQMLARLQRAGTEPSDEEVAALLANARACAGHAGG